MSNSIKDAAQMRRQAHEQAQRDDYVRALLDERQGYVVRAAAAEDAGDEKGAARMRSRVAQVDEQIELRGAAAPAAAVDDDAAVDDGVTSPGPVDDEQPRRRAAKRAPAAGTQD